MMRGRRRFGGCAGLSIRGEEPARVGQAPTADARLADWSERREDDILSESAPADRNDAV
jgi:hypothetical protein